MAETKKVSKSKQSVNGKAGKPSAEKKTIEKTKPSNESVHKDSPEKKTEKTAYKKFNYAEAKARHEAVMGKAEKKRNKKDPEKILRLASGDDMPFGYVEAYKSLRTNINFISSTENVKSIVVTSALPRESKSNVSINLAVSLATEGKKVVLVDCDLRKPAIHSYLYMGRNVRGLTDVLSGKCSLEEAIGEIEDIGIYVLPAGAIPPNPSEMLAQEKMQKVIEKLKEKFDFVIVDAPPISIVTDAAVLGKYVDGAVLVIRSKYASRDAILVAKKKLSDVDVKILGAVVTRFEAKKSAKSGYYSYGYGYDYGYKYGYGYGTPKKDEEKK